MNNFRLYISHLHNHYELECYKFVINFIRLGHKGARSFIMLWWLIFFAIKYVLRLCFEPVYLCRYSCVSKPPEIIESSVVSKICLKHENFSCKFV